MARVPHTEEQISGTSLVLNLGTVGLSQEQFFWFCSDNPDFFMELSAQKELIIMSPPGPNNSRRNAIITRELANWAQKDGTGVTFDCACHFILSNGAIRSPDASWLKRERWNVLSENDKEEAAPLCPEFVVELMSASNRLRAVKGKMEEYIANGAQLGWLIDPYNKIVYIYRPGAPVQNLEDPTTISGEPVLPGFVFNVTEIW